MIFCRTHSVEMTTISEYRDHIRLWHAGEKLFCPVCPEGNKYSNYIYKNFVMHLNRHSAIELFNTFTYIPPPAILPIQSAPSNDSMNPPPDMSLSVSHYDEVSRQTNNQPNILDVLTCIFVQSSIYHKNF